MDDLIERLRAKKIRQSAGGTAECRTFANPDGPAAIERIETLEREKAELCRELVGCVEALTELANTCQKLRTELHERVELVQ